MKFKDVTSLHLGIVATCSNNGFGPETVKVYEKDDSMIIYSFNDRVKHVSLSNTSRNLTSLEIGYAVKSIMKVNPAKVKGRISPYGVHHLHYIPSDQQEKHAVSDILQ